jgi:hypothetical protein
MFDLYEPKQKEQDFKQEYAYIEDYSLYQPPPKEKPKKKDEQRGFIEIDILGGREGE